MDDLRSYRLLVFLFVFFLLLCGSLYWNMLHVSYLQGCVDLRALPAGLAPIIRIEVNWRSKWLRAQPNNGP